MSSAQETYRGHRIELRERAGLVAGAVSDTKLTIDGAEVPYGRLPDGKYYLKNYAYDWRDDLVDLARKYIDYQENAQVK
ncbi:hypothetical protein LG047_01070 [Methylocystis sp. WRRC1]|uniref:hypothetical protein n=1 Tax=Methylocystis sp. WRRC1 TaxID=1732014 RepID=UPI001D14CB5A|nr:hypothetical protein [Methylocystis sp. WRRC1]MCC3243924.1 hypothetical protein [Methylocystis sp. WRRC1]